MDGYTDRWKHNDRLWSELDVVDEDEQGVQDDCSYNEDDVFDSSTLYKSAASFRPDPYFQHDYPCESDGNLEDLQMLFHPKDSTMVKGTERISFQRSQSNETSGQSSVQRISMPSSSIPSSSIPSSYMQNSSMPSSYQITESPIYQSLKISRPTSSSTAEEDNKKNLQRQVDVEEAIKVLRRQRKRTSRCITVNVVMLVILAGMVAILYVVGIPAYPGVTNFIQVTFNGTNACELTESVRCTRESICNLTAIQDELNRISKIASQGCGRINESGLYFVYGKGNATATGTSVRRKSPKIPNGGIDTMLALWGDKVFLFPTAMLLIEKGDSLCIDPAYHLYYLILSKGVKKVK